MHLHTDFASRFRPGAVVFTDEGQRLIVVASRSTENGLLVRLEGVDDRNASEALGKVDLFIDVDSRRSLSEGEFWPDELIGLEVRDKAGGLIGKITDIDESAMQTRLVIATEVGERLVPFVSELVPEIHLGKGYLVLKPVPGLLDADPAH